MGGFGPRAFGKAVLDAYIVLTLGNKCWICICKIWTEAKNDNEILTRHACSHKASKTSGYQGPDGDTHYVLFPIRRNGCQCPYHDS